MRDFNLIKNCIKPFWQLTKTKTGAKQLLIKMEILNQSQVNKKWKKNEIQNINSFEDVTIALFLLTI